MKIIVVGGVAGGASAAARARRLSEQAEIIVFERGAEPSFANCGMPYYIGGEIEERSKLLVAPKHRLIERYRLDLRLQTEVLRIDRAARTVEARDLLSGITHTEEYDKLILSTGAAPIRPPLPGIDLPGIYTLRDLKDADSLHQVATGSAERALIVGAGFIGIEMAENLVRRGLQVTLVELADQILPPWDKEMTTDLKKHLVEQGVDVRLSTSAQAFYQAGNTIRAELSTGKELDVDFVVLCVGVRPENTLAKEANLECGERGGIRVNDSMQTSDPDIYAIGDAVEVKEFVSGTPTQIPLGGPANRQGRIAADHIFGRESTYRGTQGTAVVGVFDMTAAMTGLSEKMLQRLNMEYAKVYIHPMNHASYYPHAERLTLKLLYSPEDGRILGAQAIGGNGVDKRIDVLATAIQARMTVYDLEEIELCYAPQYGSAKDPINMAGFVAAGSLRGDQHTVYAENLSDILKDGRLLLDVRTKKEFETDRVPEAVNIEIDRLRYNLDNLPKSRNLAVYCAAGQRGYMATRILQQHGFDAVNVSGGLVSIRQANGKKNTE